jgi:hypothetical protein
MDYGPGIPQSAEPSRRLLCRPRRGCLAQVAARRMAQGGVTLMAGTDRGAELPRRVPAGPFSPVPSAAPTLSEELRQRMLAAVKAERAEAAARAQERAAGDRTTELPRLARPPESATSKEAGPETSSPASGTNGTRNGAAAAEPAAEPGSITGPEDVTGWPGSVVRPEPAVRPEPDRRRRRAGARLVAAWPGHHRDRVAGRRPRSEHFSRSPTAAPRAGCRLGRRAGQPRCHRVMRRGDVRRTQGAWLPRRQAGRARASVARSGAFGLGRQTGRSP